MTTPPGADPHLPARLRAQSVIRDGEERIGRSWWRSMTRYLDRIRPAVTADGRVDPARVSDHNQYWTEQVDQEIVPTIGGVLADAWHRVTNQGRPQTDPWTSTYLNDVGNRLVRIPDEVYALVVIEIERGITEGLELPKVTAAVDAILTTTGSERWTNRARTIARTETMGAVNAGVWRAAALEAERSGDPAPFKQWISTDDKRTRPTHTAADQQRTLLGEPFRVGTAQLLFPGDPRGPAGEVINCRCTMLPVVLGDVIDWTERQNP